MPITLPLSGPKRTGPRPVHYRNTKGFRKPKKFDFAPNHPLLFSILYLRNTNANLERCFFCHLHRDCSEGFTKSKS
jgi:hypothetical protein